MRNPEDSTIMSSIRWIALGIMTFFSYALLRGKKKELFISTPILILLWYVERVLTLPRELFWVTLGVYAVYWIYILFIQKPKRNDFATSMHWDDEEWWWSLDGWEFEEEVGKIFKLSGYKSEVTKKTGDGGTDLILYKDKKKVLVQCKHWSEPVPVQCVRELKGIMEDYKADELIMIASSGMTGAAWKFVENKPYYKVMELRDVMQMAQKVEV